MCRRPGGVQVALIKPYPLYSPTVWPDPATCGVHHSPFLVVWLLWPGWFAAQPGAPRVWGPNPPPWPACPWPRQWRYFFCTRPHRAPYCSHGKVTLTLRSGLSVNSAFLSRGYATPLKAGSPRFGLVSWGEVKTGEAGAGAALGAQPGEGEGVR